MRLIIFSFLAGIAIISITFFIIIFLVNVAQIYEIIDAKRAFQYISKYYILLCSLPLTLGSYYIYNNKISKENLVRDEKILLFVFLHFYHIAAVITYVFDLADA